MVLNKTVLIYVVGCVSSLSFDLIARDRSAFIQSPQINGIPFNWNSSDEGVCKALGFEKAANGSGKASSQRANSIKVDTNGYVSSANNGVNVIYDRIICVNQTYHSPLEQVEKVTQPLFLRTSIPFNWNSSDEGVCRALGFEKAASGSGITSSQQSNSIKVDNNGYVSSQGSGRNTIYSEVICVNQRRSEPMQYLKLISNPVHRAARIPFSWTSSDEGVCKSLGFEDAVNGSGISGSSYSDTIKVDDSGDISDSGSGSNSTYAEVICISRR